MQRLIRLTLIVLPLVLLGKTAGWIPEAQGQVLINEACSKNNSVLQAPNGKFPDWVELYNAGSSEVLLDQYYLSDRVNELLKWQLPDVVLEPGGYLLLFSGDHGEGDLYFTFGLSSAGEAVHLVDQGHQIVSSLNIPALRSDHSYGLVEGVPRIFDVPTPGVANTTQSYPGYATMPVPSIAPGFHPSGITLYLVSGSDHTVRITTDGREPGPSSTALNGGLPLHDPTVVRAIASAPGLLPSEVFSGTYLIGVSTRLPVLSIATHPDSLWDWDRGLYVMGPEADTIFPYRGANFWRNDHIPAHLEFFDERGNLGLSQRVDLRMHGGSQARTKPQRPFRLTARKRYGSNNLAYPFFPERGILERYEQLVLRNSSGDFCLSNFRDGYWHQVSLHNGLNVDVLGFRPVTVYLNGSYWGWMNLRERINLELLANDYGAIADSVLLMGQENESVQGDTIHFHQVKELITQADLNLEANWSLVEAVLDIPSFKDYMALEMFAGNADWPANNVRYWKPSINSGKWRYLLHDLDATMNVYGWIPMDIDMFYWVLDHRAGRTLSEVLRGLLSNNEFRRTFLNRFADLMNTAFRVDALQREEDLILAAVEGEVSRHYSRWQCYEGAFQHHAGTLLPEFFEVRADHVRAHILDRFNFPNAVTLDLDAFPAGAGRVTLNTIEPELPFHGVYFNGNAIDLTAHASEGFHFDHWEYTGDNDRMKEPTIRREFPVNGRVTAYFRPLNEQLLAYPNPFTDHVTLSVNSPLAGPAVAVVHDLRGRELLRSAHGLGEGINQLRLDLNGLSSGTYIIAVHQESTSSTARVVKMAP